MTTALTDLKPLRPVDRWERPLTSRTKILLDMLRATQPTTRRPPLGLVIVTENTAFGNLNLQISLGKLPELPLRSADGSENSVVSLVGEGVTLGVPIGPGNTGSIIPNSLQPCTILFADYAHRFTHNSLRDTSPHGYPITFEHLDARCGPYHYPREPFPICKVLEMVFGDETAIYDWFRLRGLDLLAVTAFQELGLDWPYCEELNALRESLRAELMTFVDDQTGGFKLRKLLDKLALLGVTREDLREQYGEHCMKRRFDKLVPKK